jgi:uncharacterized protein YutE (UPF0331/DUF86 family)
MVDENVIAAKLAELADRVARVRSHRPADADALAEDRDAFDLVAFNLMLAVQACVDVAAHLIADEGWAPAADLADCFQRLQEHRVVSRDTAEALARATGLRNVVAHVYAHADPRLVFRAASSGLDDLDRFSHEVAAWLKRRTSAS